MAQVVWLDAAERDVHDLHAFIARDSPRRADTLVRRIRSTAERLARFPLSGRAVPERGDIDFREVIVQPYRVIYHYLAAEDRVAILAVVHGRRRLPPIEGEE